MLVAYDHSIFSIQEQGGISRYFVELAKHLSAHQDMQPRIVAPVHVCRTLRDDTSLPTSGIYVPKVKKTYRALQFINNVLSSRTMKQLQPDIIHATYYLARYKKPRASKKIITVFDMIHEKFSTNMDRFEQTLPEIKKKVIAEADHVICISEQTRHDVIELLDIAREKTSVIHLASSFSGLELSDADESEKNSLLYVGSRMWPKNFNRCVEAFGILRQQHPDISLVCFGGGPFTSEELNLFKHAGLREGNVRLCSGDDYVLQGLYRKAVALVYPSLYEGFGLPLLEAMACGCPVICSNISSMPEVAGEAALYFSPTMPDEIAEAMQQVVESTELRKDLAAKGRKRVSLFSWEKCARETAEVYRSCLQA